MTTRERRAAAAEALFDALDANPHMPFGEVAALVLEAADRAAADGVSPPPPDALRELDERCEKAEATLAGCADADPNHRNHFESKRQGVALVRDYLRPLLAASGPLPPPPPDRVMTTEGIATEAIRVLRERFGDAAFDVISLLRLLEVPASGPLPERGPVDSFGEYRDDIYFVPALVDEIERLKADAAERGDAAEQLAEALRRTARAHHRLAHTGAFTHCNMSICLEALEALAAFSAPRTPEGTENG